MRSNDPTIIALAEVVLSGEGIDSFALDVHMSVLEGSIGIFPKRLMVADRDVFLARIALRDHGIEVST